MMTLNSISHAWPGSKLAWRNVLGIWRIVRDFQRLRCQTTHLSLRDERGRQVSHYVPRPDVTIAFDVDQPAAAATRKRLLERVSATGELIAGMHLNFPGFARLSKRGESFEIRHEPWSAELI
jgi:hypothetical protein